MTVTYEFDEKPGFGETLKIADGVHWLRMPLPMDLAHINLWLLEEDTGWAVVDTGINTEDTREIWQKTVTGLMADKPIDHVVVTHLHPDHVGCAGWLVDEYDIDLWMAREEYLLCRILVADTGKIAPKEGVRFYKAAGFPEEALDRYVKLFGFFGKYVAPLPEAYRRLRDGEKLVFAGHTWEIVVGRGHSLEHACLFDEARNLFISGDQLLPTISSNVSVYPTEPLANPLRDWLDSLAYLKEKLPEDVLVLPAHGKPFRGAHQRLDELTKEHTDGLEALHALCAEPKRAVDVFPALFKGRVTDRNMIMATGESIAHLNYLVEAGKLSAATDSDGVQWYEQR
jgi:glyoxylase-like metal-dependent hydrolase (beta-lactamase superfamily II)